MLSWVVSCVWVRVLRWWKSGVFFWAEKAKTSFFTADGPGEMWKERPCMKPCFHFDLVLLWLVKRPMKKWEAIYNIYELAQILKLSFLLNTEIQNNFPWFVVGDCEITSHIWHRVVRYQLCYVSAYVVWHYFHFKNMFCLPPGSRLYSALCSMYSLFCHNFPEILFSSRISHFI